MHSQIILPGSDEVFFADHPDRKARMRRPRPGEFAAEFASLGPHAAHRRRIIVARVEPTVARRYRRALMAIPFLAFADEEIADRDDVLLPILAEIMRGAAAEPRGC